jgi:hypothetical protein
MNSEPDPTQAPKETLLAALYQVTARWYANDAQLIWRRLTLLTTLNSGLLTAQVFGSHLSPLVRVPLPLLGIALSWYWLALISRTWRIQDYQAAVLRDQECKMGLAHLGAFSRLRDIRETGQPDPVVISGVSFLASEFSGSRYNRTFSTILSRVFLCLHIGLLILALAGVSLQSRSEATTVPGSKSQPTPTPAGTTPIRSATPPETPP